MSLLSYDLIRGLVSVKSQSHEAGFIFIFYFIFCHFKKLRSVPRTLLKAHLLEVATHDMHSVMSQTPRAYSLVGKG